MIKYTLLQENGDYSFRKFIIVISGSTTNRICVDEPTLLNQFKMI